MRPILKVVSVLVAMLLIISTVQWIAFHRAEERVESLPCDTRLAPYRVEVESMLPPSKLLKDATGHRLNNGRVEAVIPEEVGTYSPDYKIFLSMAEGDLNYSVASLKQALGTGNGEFINEAFYSLKVHYFKLKFVEEYGQTNITEVSFRPSPPLKWALWVRNVFMILLQSSYVRAAIAALLISTAFFGAILGAMFLIARLPETNGIFRRISALLIVIMIFTAAFGGLVGVLRYLGPFEDEKGLTISKNPCEKSNSLHPDLADFFRMSLNHIWENGKNTTSCEVLQYLHTALNEEELNTLQKTLNVSCP